MKFVLILTLMMQGSFGGAGGVAMQEFNNKADCVVAGDVWIALANERWYKKKEAFYLCVPKRK